MLKKQLQIKGVEVRGIDALPKLSQKDTWDNNEFDSKRNILISIKPKIISEARRLLLFFQDKLIKIIKENDFSDYRNEEGRKNRT